MDSKDTNDNRSNDMDINPHTIATIQAEAIAGPASVREAAYTTEIGVWDEWDTALEIAVASATRTLAVLWPDGDIHIGIHIGDNTDVEQPEVRVEITESGTTVAVHTEEAIAAG